MAELRFCNKLRVIKKTSSSHVTNFDVARKKSFLKKKNAKKTFRAVKRHAQNASAHANAQISMSICTLHTKYSFKSGVLIIRLKSGISSRSGGIS